MTTSAATLMWVASRRKRTIRASNLSSDHISGALPKFIANFKTENDCDLYSSTLYCLTKLDSVLPAGTILMFDEFGDVQHKFRAVHDYLASYRRQVRVLCSHNDFLRSQSSFNDRTAWSLVGRKQRERGRGCAVTGGHSSLRRHSDELVEITAAAAQSVRDFRDEGMPDSGCNNRDRRRRWPARQDQHRGVGDGAHLRFREPAGDQPPRGIVGVGRIGADHAREACL